MTYPLKLQAAMTYETCNYSMAGGMCRPAICESLHNSRTHLRAHYHHFQPVIPAIPLS